MKRRLLIKACVAPALLLLFAGCNRLSELPDRHAREAPPRGELVGRWAMDARSLERVRAGRPTASPKDGQGEQELTLREDGTCSYRAFAVGAAGHLAAEGRWEIVTSESVDGGGGRRPAVELTLTPEPSHYVTVRLWIAREGGALVLWDYVGDPDEVRYVDFRKA